MTGRSRQTRAALRPPEKRGTDREGYPNVCAECGGRVTLKQRATLAAVVHADGSETRSTFHMSCLEAAKAAREEARADV